MRVTKQDLSNWIGAESLGEDTITDVVDCVEHRVIFGDPRFVLTLRDSGSFVRLNLESLRALVETYGEETDAWIGQAVTLSTSVRKTGDRQQRVLLVEPYLEPEDPEPTPSKPTRRAKGGKMAY